MPADADRPPSTGHPSARQALQRALAWRVAIAVALFAVVGAALIVSKSDGDGPNAPVTATPPPDAIAQSPAPSARVPETDSTAPEATAIAPAEPGPAASADPAAGAKLAAGGEATAAPAASASSGSERTPDRVGSEAPASGDAARGAVEPEPQPAAAGASKSDAVEPPQPAAAEPEPSAPPAVRASSRDKPVRGPRLQAGVFAHASNARALKAKLEAHDFPAFIESRAETGQSRVYVGPFKDRKEAQRAREKLQELGVATLLIAQ